MLTTFWSNLSPYAAPTAAQTAAATTPAAFAGWPSAVQASFVRANGSGTPRSLVIGAAGEQVLAQLGADGATVTTTAVPRDFGTTASQVTLNQFSGWAAPIQALYIQANGGATLGSGAGTFSASLSPGGAAVTTTGSAAMGATNAAALATAPATLTAATFFALPDDERAAYLQTFADATGQLAIGGAAAASGAPVVTLQAGGRSFSVTVPLASYTGFNDALQSLGVSHVRGFEAWPRPVQVAYLQTQAAKQASAAPGYAINFPRSGSPRNMTARLDATGTGLTLTATPSQFTTDPAKADLDLFLSWPAESQAVFVEANLAPSGVTTLSTLAGTTATLQRGAANGFTVTPSAGLTALAPDKMDPILFGLLSAADRASYFAANAFGSPLTLTLAGGKASVLVYQGTGTGLSELAYPTGFTRSPTTLTASTFLSWDPLFRQLYVAANGAGSPKSLVVGSGTDAVSTALHIVNGTTVLSVAPIPYFYMPGAASGVTSPINDQTAGTLFPILDGSGGRHNVTPLPSSFGTAPAALSASEFTSWNTAVQLQYLRQHPAVGSVVQIGSGSDRVDAFIQTRVTAGAIPKVYIVQNIQKSDIGAMAFSDQKILAASAAFSGGSPSLAQGLGLIPDYHNDTSPPPTGAAAPVTGSMVGGIGGDMPDPHAGLTSHADMSGVTLSAFGYVQQMFVTALNTLANPAQASPTALPAGNMSAGDLQVFQDEVNLLRKQTFGDPLPATQAAQTAGQAIYSPKDIQDKLTAILTRFKRVNAFSASSQQANGYYEPSTADPSVNVFHLYPTRPDAGAIAQGLTTLMAQEGSILDLANRASQLAGSGTLANTHQSLDVPNMVYLFQLFANLSGEAVLRADTEEVNQTNQLLNIYATMQKIINQTVASIPPQNDSKTTPKAALRGSNPDGSFTDAEKAVVAMFNNQHITGTTGTPASSPIELLNGITRPLSNLSSTNSLTAQAWSSIGTSLSDAVTQINQASQLKMNDINAETKQKDRQFDLANTALQKAAEVVSKVASAA